MISKLTLWGGSRFPSGSQSKTELLLLIDQGMLGLGRRNIIIQGTRLLLLLLLQVSTVMGVNLLFHHHAAAVPFWTPIVISLCL